VPDAGIIVVLNGSPRSGKSTIAIAVQESLSGTWMNLGVDAFSEYVIPEQLRPGIGLRPGGERPDLEEQLPVLFDALYAAVIGVSRLGLHVVVDVGHHDDYSEPLGILGRVARQLEGLPAYLVGVRCPVEVIMQRRDAGDPGRVDRYVTSGPDGAVPDSVLRWERAVHHPGIYDLEVDTSVRSARECVAAIRARVGEGPPTAFAELAGRA
jgi:chloramphenicol 3-O phosphotransferase